MLRQAQRLAVNAINQRGVPLYNSGNVEGCAQVYANTILDIVGMTSKNLLWRTQLMDGMTRIKCDDSDTKAWQLRALLDALINNTDEAGEPPTTTKLSFKENIPVKFYSIDDRVMGGRSSSRMIHSSEHAAAIFQGNLTDANNGGFASVRSAVRMDWSSATAVRIVASSPTGGLFKVRLQDTEEMNAVCFQHDFQVPVCTSNGTWQQFDLPLTQFVPTWRGVPQPGTTIDWSRVQSLGFMISMFDTSTGKKSKQMPTGEFHLMVQSVEGIR